MMNLGKPILENKVYGPGGGIPLLKSLWEKFDLSLLFLQTEFQKHSGISAWLMAFAYICGLIAKKTSVNQNAEFSSDSPVLSFLLKGKTISQSAFSRFFSKPYHLKYNDMLIPQGHHNECDILKLSFLHITDHPQITFFH